MTTDVLPIYDAVIASTPYPKLLVDTSFAWTAPNRAPRPGQKPRRKRKK